MRKILLGVAVASCVLFCLSGQALAVGFGGYLEGASGAGEFEYDFSSEFDVDSDSRGFGFVMDTDLSDRGVFNYRLNVGFEKLELDDDLGDNLELDGLVVANTFGFALIKKPDLRWWIGPEVRVGFYSGELNSEPLVDYDMVSFGLGAVTGVNVVSGNLCISTSLGIRTTGYAGETDELGPNRDFEGQATTAFVNIALLFGN